MLPKGKKGLSRLSIFFKATKNKDFRNKFFSKAQCYKADFSNSAFINVNFKGAILTSCDFKNTSFSQVEFLGSNLKKSNFTGAIFKRCVFSGALMKKTNFRNCKFYNCTFVNTNLQAAKNLVVDGTNKILKIHPTPAIDDELLTLLNEFRFNSKIQNSRVLYLKGGKLNGLTVQSLLDRFGSTNLKKGLKDMNGHLPYRIITANCLSDAIDGAARFR